jgi:nitrite reductase/ring-hydroxylating ferredoxin subunit
MDVFLTSDTELPFSAQALGLRHQAQFHPLKLLAALASDLTIFERSRVLDVHGHTLRTAHGVVTARKIIFTCHYPFINLPGYYFLRQHQDRSYVLSLDHAAPLQNHYLGIDGSKLSFRSCGKTLLLGGSGHRTGENGDGSNYELLERAAQRYWPESHVSLRWSAQDCMPMDGIPYIGPYAEHRPDWLVATGFQKWGMSSSVLASMILPDLAQNQPPIPEAAVFSPHRFHLSASAGQLAEDTLHAARGLSRRLLSPGRISPEALPVGHGGIVEIDGEKLGAYRDETGELHVVSVKCPHLGCQLEWNPADHSWDCPCHGSRFDIHGRLLNGPATSDL